MTLWKSLDFSHTNKVVKRILSNLKKLVRPCEFDKLESNPLKAQLYLDYTQTFQRNTYSESILLYKKRPIIVKQLSKLPKTLISIDKLRSVEIDEIKSTMSGN